MSNDNYDDGEDFELPPDDVPRFAYEAAEEVLDRWASRQDAGFQRAWMKTKGMAALYAYGDYFDGVMHPVLAMSRGWEELQIAFTGQGEAFLSGAVLHLWNSLPDVKAEKSFGRVVRKAFKAAEGATPSKAVRLYMKKYRNAPLRNPDDGFTLEPVLPAQGVRLREWALAGNLDVDAVEEQFMWLEMADRSGDDEDDDPHTALAAEVQQGGPWLQLLDGGKSDQETSK